MHANDDIPREERWRTLAVQLACKLPGLAPFDYEWELLKPDGLSPQDLAYLKADGFAIDPKILAMGRCSPHELASERDTRSSTHCWASSSEWKSWSTPGPRAQGP